MKIAEWGWAVRFSAAIMLLTVLPYAAGFELESDKWKFTGFVFAVQDGNSYIAKMQQGAQGAWLYKLAYSSELQSGALVFAYYLLLGKLAAGEGLHEQLVALFHTARLLSGFVLLLVCYRFSAEFLLEVRQRRLGLLLVALGGGLGWLLAIFAKGNWLGSLPLDFYSPESFTFLALYGLPHIAAARALLLGGMILYLSFFNSNSNSNSKPILAGLLFLLLSLIQPLYVLVGYAVLGSHTATLWLVRERAAAGAALRACILIGLISSPIVIYTALAFTLDPILKQWSAQNIVRSPHPLHYLAAYGLLLIPALASLSSLYRQDPVKAAFLVGWLVVLPVLLYAPFNLNRRLAEGFHVALVTLAVAGLSRVTCHVSHVTYPPPGAAQPPSPVTRYPSPITLLVLALSLPTTLLLFSGGLLAVSNPAEPLFIPRAQVEVMDWLAKQSRPGTVVLSAYETGNIIPAYAPLISYIGHGPETVYLPEKEGNVRAFFSAATPEAARRSLLAEGRIGYVLFGPHEAALGDFDPAGAPYLHARATSGDYTVYEVGP